MHLWTDLLLAAGTRRRRGHLPYTHAHPLFPRDNARLDPLASPQLPRSETNQIALPDVGFTLRRHSDGGQDPPGSPVHCRIRTPTFHEQPNSTDISFPFPQLNYPTSTNLLLSALDNYELVVGFGREERRQRIVQRVETHPILDCKYIYDIHSDTKVTHYKEPRGLVIYNQIFQQWSGRNGSCKTPTQQAPVRSQTHPSLFDTPAAMLHFLHTAVTLERS